MLSGNGSAITLTVLMEVIGLPAGVANATNRVGILGNSLAGTLGFYRGGRFDLVADQRRQTWTIIIVGTLGAVLGVYLSLVISNAAFRNVFRYLLVVMLFVVLIKPKRWLRKQNDPRTISNWLGVPLYFAIGVYGGFIQMGMGVFFLAIMVLIARYEIIQANVVKVVVVSIYTALAVAIFAWRGLIDWPIGLLMAAGQMIGGYVTAKYASEDPRAGKVAYWLLVVVIIGGIWRAFS